MLSADALRLAAIEVLRPTVAVEAGEGFPTLAAHRVFDSRAAAVGDLDDRSPSGYTPTLSIYSHSSRITRRADAAAPDDNECEAVLEIVAELATVQRDGEGEFVDAVAGGDADARLVLGALTAQVRFLLEFSQGGRLFRRAGIGVRRIDEETFAVPDLGLRWHRVTMRVTAAIPDDRFDLEAGGLPEPLATLAAALPDGSYAKGKLTELAAHFAGEARTPLAGIAIFDDPDGDAGEDQPVAAIGDIDGED